jgi:hypothetical protein
MKGEREMDSFITNGRGRCTLIQKMTGGVIVIGPHACERLEFKSIEEATPEIEARNWAVGTSHPGVLSMNKEEA